MSTPAQTLKSTRIIHIALLSGVSIFTITALYLHQGIVVWNTEEMLLLIALLLALSTTAASFILSNQLLKRAAQATTTEGKLNQYLSAKVTQWALLEGPALFAAVVIMLTQNGFALLLVLILIVLMAATYPSKSKMEVELQL